MAVVYRHIRLDRNEPFYIGVGRNVKRAYDKGNRRKKIWNEVVKDTPYEVEILFDDIEWEEAQEKEKEFIKLYGRINTNTGTLVNLTDGGKGCVNRIVSEETKLKISFKQKIISNKIDERRRRSERMKGSNNPLYGKPSVQRGKKRSPEILAKIAATKKLNPKIVPWNKGIPKTEEEKKAHSLKVYGKYKVILTKTQEGWILKLKNEKVSLRKMAVITGVTRPVIARFIKRHKPEGGM